MELDERSHYSRRRPQRGAGIWCKAKAKAAENILKRKHWDALTLK
jgi:hypothetical protein